MKGGTLFSGIDAPEVSAPEIDWRWRAEIDRFANAVSEHHRPGVPNLGDVGRVRADEVEPVDLVVFGSPCQSFSVAGKRLGLDDPRGNLALVALALVAQLRPRWVVFENVPGLLSNWSGDEGSDLEPGQSREIVESSDFAAFLGTVQECGYLGGWRVLDAQYSGLAQRRDRVFAVFHLGDWRPAAEVLFEPESLSGHPPPSREAGKGTTAAASTGFGGGRRSGPVDVSAALTAHGRRQDFEVETFIAHSLRAQSQLSHREDQDTLIAHALRADGFDASEDGTGRGTPLVPVAFDTTQITSKANRCNPKAGDPCHPLAAGAHAPAIAFSCKDHGADAGDVSPALRAMGHDGSHANAGGQVAVAFTERGRDQGRTLETQHELAYCLTNPGSGGRTHSRQLLDTAMRVRRLTPRECERLQGFPDDYTLVPYRSKPAADGPRYKTLGNSMAVPVIGWILRRLQMVDASLRRAAA